MRCIAMCLVLLTCFFLQASAQRNNDKKALYIHSLLGVNVPGINSLNNSLQQNGHLTLPSTYFARGGGLYAFFNNTRLVSFVTFSSYSGSRNEDNRRNWVRGTQLGTALGIDIKRRGRLQAIPYAGADISLMGLRLSNAAAGTGLFGPYLAGSPNQYEVSLSQWMPNLGLHIGASPLGHKGFAQKLDLALRTGYHLPFSQGNWKTPGRNLVNGPEVNSAGFYASLVFGVRQ